MKYGSVHSCVVQVIMLVCCLTSLSGCESLPQTSASTPCVAPLMPDDLKPYLVRSGHCHFRLQNVPYGNHERQKLDLYLPKQIAGAPSIFMVHGGAWRFGNKDNSSVVNNKIERWVARNIVLVSSNYRLLPDADPHQQSEDLIQSLAYTQWTLSRLGADQDSLVLMGHSAGAHLVNLINADPHLAYAKQVKPWLGVVSLDGAAMDVESIMADPHPGFYDMAFGQDVLFWKQVSPIEQHTPLAKPLLLVCSELRVIACGQARAYAQRARESGTVATVLPVPLTHGQINRGLGKNSSYTHAVEAFMKSLGDSFAGRL